MRSNKIPDNGVAFLCADCSIALIYSHGIARFFLVNTLKVKAWMIRILYQKGDWLCVPVFAHLAVTDQRIHEILSFVHFSLNCKAAFHGFSRCKLSLRFFSESVQPRLHIRLSKQGIPFQFFFVGVVVSDLW